MARKLSGMELPCLAFVLVLKSNIASASLAALMALLALTILRIYMHQKNTWQVFVASAAKDVPLVKSLSVVQSVIMCRIAQRSARSKTGIYGTRLNAFQVSIIEGEGDS